MAFGRKPAEEIIKEETKVWECTSDTCNVWVRDNFKAEEHENCLICGSPMQPNTKVLEVIHNGARKQQSLKPEQTETDE